jgi:SAM-dependent methyltransferase
MIGKRYEYEAMAECEKNLWWYKCLHEKTLHYIKNNFAGKSIKILDAGCGTGGMLSFLQKNGYTNLHGFDLSEDAVAYASNKTGFNIQKLDLLAVDKVFQKESFDVVISNDTICLLQPPNDKLLISKLCNLLQPGGMLIFNTAALKLFSGTHDVVVEMKKRYTLPEVKNLVPPHMKIITTLFWPFILSPLIFGLRAAQRLKLQMFPGTSISSDVKMPHPLFNYLFYKATVLENKLPGNKPFGSSIFTVLQKEPVSA